MLLITGSFWAVILCVFLFDRKYVGGVRQSIGDTHVIGKWSTNPHVSLIYGGLEGFIMGERGQINLMQGWFEPCKVSILNTFKADTSRSEILCDYHCYI